MPCICSFDGISIYMYYNDHMPPHFHAIYGQHEAIIVISTLAVDRGALPLSTLMCSISVSRPRGLLPLRRAKDHIERTGSFIC